MPQKKEIEVYGAKINFVDTGTEVLPGMTLQV